MSLERQSSRGVAARRIPAAPPGPGPGEVPTDDQIERAAALLRAVRASVSTVVQGKRAVVDLVLTAALAEGHVLVEDVPGVGKTLLAKAVARAIGGDTRRIQGTPDLLPGDLTGVSIFERDTGEFRFRPGPLFANVVLCDEINRATPKAQAALLEAMEERTVTVDGVSYLLPRPWIVIATQNPVEQSGTHPLPESQLDRFLVRTSIGYPSRDDELVIAAPRDAADPVSVLAPVTTAAELADLVSMTRRVHVASALRAYVVDVVRATREHRQVRVGVSPRGIQSWVRAAQARAVLGARSYVTPDDLQALARPVLSHRLVLAPTPRHSTGATGAQIIDECLEQVPVPTGRRGVG
jgi:MoxR-like ATPase